jgi:hypothetical protein
MYNLFKIRKINKVLKKNTDFYLGIYLEDID